MFLEEVRSYPYYAVVGLIVFFVGRVKMMFLLYVLLPIEKDKRLEPSLEHWVITIFLVFRA